MVVEEDYFPRGKQKSEKVEGEEKVEDLNKEKKFVNIFSEKDTNVKLQKKKKIKGVKTQVSSVLFVKSVPTLSYSDLKQGMVLSGVVSEVAEFEVRISLPGHLVASLPITNISSAYTDALRKAAEAAEDDGDDDVVPLSSLFTVGQFLVVAVVSCEKGKHYKVIVSVDPNHVMAGRIPGEGDLCVASILSKEDHGYIMDVGNKTVRGFIPNKAAAKHWIKDLREGMSILCVVVKKEKGAIILKCDPGKVFNTARQEPNLHNTLPGTTFNGKVLSHLENGLKVGFGKDLVGYLHQNLLPSPVEDLKSIPLGSEIKVRLVYVVPTINTVILSARSVYPFKQPFQEIKTGTFISDAEILVVTSSYLLVQLSESCIGYVSARQARSTPEDKTNLKEKYKIGEKVKARVLGLDYYSEVAVCTLQKALLSGLSKIDNLTIGQKVRGTIKGFVDGGLEVKVGATLVGFIPTLFLSDVRLQHPEKKFFIGDKIDCRVLRVNPKKNRLHLTSKPILVKEEFSIVSTYEQAVVGTITEGVITKITQHGLLISLFGDLMGFAPKHMISEEVIQHLEKLFFLGQAVKCQIVGSDEEKNRITLSLKIGSMKPLGKKQKERGKSLALGSIYTAKVTGITEKGLDCEVEKDELCITCCIPTQHLTDNTGLAAALLNHYKVDDSVEAVCFQHDVVPVLTLKQSIIRAVQEGCLPDEFSKIEVGSLLPAVLQSIKPFGIFLRLPVWSYWKPILVPNRHIANFYMERPADVLEIGQTLIVKITEKVDDGMRLAGSTNFMDMPIKSSETVDVMKGILQDLALLRSKSEKLSSIRIGDLLTATVKEITDMGAILDVSGHVSLAPQSNLGDSQLKPGDRVPAMVLFVDYQAGVLEVSCDPGIITKAAVCVNIPEVGSNVKGKIILTRTELNLRIVSVTSPAKFAGCLVYTPTVIHLNDLAGEDTELVVDKLTNINIQVSGDEIIGLNDRQHRLQGKKRRDRHNSLDDSGKSKRMRTESESSVSQLLASVQTSAPELLNSAPEQKSPAKHVDNKSEILPDFVPPNPVSPKVAKKRKATNVEKDTTLESSAEPNTESSSKPSVELETGTPEKKRNRRGKKKKKSESKSKKTEDTGSEEPTLKDPVKEKEKVVLADPGWDFSLTSVTLPAWGQVSIWGDEEAEAEESEADTSKKHVGKKEAKELRRKEEIAAEREEKKVLDGENLPPSSSQEFEKLVLSSPDSSLVWIQYMAFYLQTCQYDQARAVATRAIQRINFREEGEILNVYLAWLNLENTFGNPESLQKVLKSALERNDEYKVYSQMADIFSKSGKQLEAENIFKILAKKFSKVKEVWVRFGLFYYKNTRVEDGRFVFTRSLQNLEARDATDISAKFAQIEFRYGDPETGKTMYEKLVTSHPKRVDLWTSYADQLTRIGDTSAARALYARISTLGLQAKKMKSLFGRWLEFEKVHGTEEQQGEVRRSALQYLNAKNTGDTMDI
ncbi:protein RRP5 homolog isoform X2 [Eurytemora carolleeae]|uniref:protein RRP5 homolog isoform X2 n=1 Tax=Eurytemora carolleeae TaxID=1294199 RepID=UPI000C7771E9|nr:protein RRP5 homolog isoform X2 [Eurytemora carolleeae]|eukprot:XP_023328574.1 protein RRP5 homolog isoform X2 [Eurytemora affinis]